MTTQKNRLPAPAAMGYISGAPAKSGAGICTPVITLAHDRASGFFVCDAQPHLRIMVGRAGQPEGWPGSSVTGSANPVRLTTPEICTSGGELFNLTLEDASSWQTADSAARTRSVSTRRPKSVAASGVHLISCRPCTSVCCTKKPLRYRHSISPPYSAISLTTCTTCSSSLTPGTTPAKTRIRPPLLPAAGGLRTPAYQEVHP
ncbi:hypothetical protein CYD30_28005 [Kosakonia cowanii]|nr:hypothetical protein CYD30_28005 [Kosakonia cowanii]